MGLIENIQKLSEKKNVTRYRLAKETKIPYTTLIKILDGTTKKPQIESLSPIAEYFGVSVDYLIGESAKSIIDCRAEELGLSLDDIAHKANVSLAFLKDLESIIPDPWDYEAIDRIARVLNLEPSILQKALYRQEPPAYDGPTITAEEAFGGDNAIKLNVQLTEDEILTLAAHQVGHEGELTESDLDKIKLAVKIALAKDNK
ncbi:DNA-binding helix-turn-helix protein [Desulfitobacterium hafniense DP7]|uniref:DNA-binding helix-turn-helix protein n=1 Tax=Desulfitobacterium hafniense DP7 TaxID=537010 RepID=G9XHL1_DESHA|nr:helix-turn-helix transcriptional regulator [Desulfitobacterium hafniense]EHL08794.1 DNA-binding helix-turn-helix protein [Desulfitobacterium hafniense DP7]